MDKARKPRGFRKSRTFFGWIFILSLLIFLVSGVMTTLDMGAGEKAAPPPPADATARLLPMETDHSAIVLGASLVTGVTSFLGFLSTTILGWRREKREVEAAARDAQIKDLELQKLKRELGERD
jgi:hypothetical protein